MTHEIYLYFISKALLREILHVQYTKKHLEQHESRLINEYYVLQVTT